jgi:hypothetical protein
VISLSKEPEGRISQHADITAIFPREAQHDVRERQTRRRDRRLVFSVTRRDHCPGFVERAKKNTECVRPE